MMCDKRKKGNVHKTAMVYGLQTVALRKSQEAELDVAETKTLSFSLGVIRLNRMRNKYTRGTAHVRSFEN